MKNKKLSLREKLGVSIMLHHAEEVNIHQSESDPEFNDVEFCVDRRWGNIVRAVSGKSPQDLFTKYSNLVLNR